MSKLFVIYRHSHLYAFTPYKWLARLFLIDRSSYNLTIHKIKNNEFDNILQNFEECQIHYFYGYALTSKEYEFIIYSLQSYYDPLSIRRSSIEYALMKKKKYIKYYRQEIVPTYIRELSQYAINNDSVVEEVLRQKQFLNSLKYEL